jgi:hypothetical protein
MDRKMESKIDVKNGYHEHSEMQMSGLWKMENGVKMHFTYLWQCLGHSNPP